MKNIPHRIILSEDQLPKQWYNLRADMKEQPDPMLNPATGKPAAEEDLYPVFCRELAHQEMDCSTRYMGYPGGDPGILQNVPSLPADPGL